MNLLHVNDRPGEYPRSWYAATTPVLPPFEPLRGETTADVCIVGAGYTGLSAALHLAQAGRRVVLLDAQRVGFGASGRNGGQVGSGQRVEQPDLDRMLGKEQGARLWRLGEEAKQLVKDLVATHQIDCDLKPGIAWGAAHQSDVSDLHAYADYMSRAHDHPVEALDRAAFQAICPSPSLKGGVLDESAAHLNPLAYAFGLARAAEAAGAIIHEQSEVHHITRDNTVQTGKGRVKAEHVILACNGYLGGLNRKVAARVMPINNFIVATEPLGAETARVLTRDIAVSDARFVINYWRLSPDGRLLFGGGESYGHKFPKDIESLVRKPMSQVYPHLKDVKIDYAWGGTLAITMKRLPFVARVGERVLSASGYSGHGVSIATLAGRLMAEAVQGESEGFEAMASIPTHPFPGGPAMRTPLLSLAMTWYAMRDRLGV